MITLPNSETFNGRENILEILRKNQENIKHGKGQNIALVGQRNIGKTSILKKIDGIYIDLEKLSLSPESFSMEILEKVARLYGKKVKDLKNETVSLIINELEKIKPDQVKLLGWAFDFLESHDKVLVIDEFHKVLDFNNFGQIKDILSLLKERKWKQNLVVASSAESDMKKIAKKLDMTVVEVSGLDRESVKELIEQYIKIGEKEVDKIYSLTQGIPLYVVALCKRYKELKSVEKAFVYEIVSEEGIIHNALKFNLTESLGRARGQSLLMSVMKTLAQNDNLRLTDISSKIYRSGPVTKSIVDRLVQVDIISKENKLFSIAPVLKYFIYQVYVMGNDITELNKLAREVFK